MPIENTDYPEAHLTDQNEGTATQFNWSELYTTFNESTHELAEHDFEGLVVALRRILQWLVEPGVKKMKHRKMLVRRVAALAWVIDPSLLDGSPSLRQLAKHMHDKQPMSLSEHTAAASRTFGLRNRSQVGHCIAYHPKRKSTSKAVTRSGQSKGIF